MTSHNTEQELKDLAIRLGVPSHTASNIAHYVYNGGGYSNLGGFGTSLMSNDLFGTYNSADSANYNAIKEIISLIYNHCPMLSWGSMKKVNEWTGLNALNVKAFTQEV